VCAVQSIHLRILNGPPSSIPNEAAELALLSLLEFCSEPSLMVDVYVNYDCDISYSNLFDNIVNTLFLYATSQERFGVLQVSRGEGRMGEGAYAERNDRAGTLLRTRCPERASVNDRQNSCSESAQNTRSERPAKNDRFSAGTCTAEAPL